MKILTLLFCLFVFIISGRGQSLSPELITASGDFLEGTLTSLSFSIGECMIEDFSNSNGSLSQGFQQGIEVIIQIEDEKIYPGITVFPVPATHSITIRMEEDTRELTATILSLDGKTILQENLGLTETTIHLDSTEPGIYILNIEDHSGIFIQSYQIVKL